MKRYQIALLFFALGIFAVASLLVFWAKKVDEPSLLFKTYPQEYNSILVFFSNNLVDSRVLNCDITYPAKRDLILKTNTENGRLGELAYQALSELLKGPSDLEKKRGFFTSINEGSKIQKISIENKVATVDFNYKLNDAVAGPCKVQAIRSQIIQTLKQFPEIKEVIISINSRTEDILQP